MSVNGSATMVNATTFVYSRHAPSVGSNAGDRDKLIPRTPEATAKDRSATLVMKTPSSSSAQSLVPKFSTSKSHHELSASSTMTPPSTASFPASTSREDDVIDIVVDASSFASSPAATHIPMFPIMVNAPCAATSQSSVAALPKKCCVHAHMPLACSGSIPHVSVRQPL